MTNNETEKIGDIVEEIRKRVTEVDSANKIVIDKVFLGNKKIKVVNENIKNMIDLTENNDKLLEDISNRISEQTNSSLEITKAVETITISASEIEGLVIETTELTEDFKDMLIENVTIVHSLSGIVDELDHKLKYFKANKEIKEK